MIKDLLIPFYGMEIEHLISNGTEKTLISGKESEVKFIYYYDSYKKSVNLRSLKRYDSLVEVLKKVYQGFNTKDEYDYGTYKICIEYSYENKIRRLELMSIEKHEQYFVYDACIKAKDLNEAVRFINVGDSICHVHDKNRKVEFVFNNKEMLENIPELKNFAYLIELSVPNKRKVSAKGRKSLEKKSKDTLKVLDNKEKALCSKYGFKIEKVKITNKLRDSFYMYVEECMSDMFKHVKNNYKLNKIDLRNTTSAHGRYYPGSMKIELSTLMIKRYDKSTYYHEYGHHLYYQLLKVNKYKSLVEELLSELRKMETVKSIRLKKKENEKTNETYRLTGKGTRKSNTYLNYLLEGTELFARLFETYMSDKAKIQKKDLEKREFWLFNKEEIDLLERYLKKFNLLV